MVQTSLQDDRHDFTEAHYLTLLREAKSRYLFATYSSIPWGEKFVLWRHDVEFSINRALRLAELEKQVGITSTYFVNLHSNFYNPLEASQSGLIKQILDHGHSIGIHFDTNYYGLSSEKDLEKKLKVEQQTLENFLQCPIKAFSFHNPSSLNLTWSRDEYADLTNCYSEKLLSRSTYCSDSNGYWRYQRLLDLIVSESAERLQILTHDGHWQNGPMAPRDRILRCVFGRANSVISDYDQTLADGNRENRSDMPSNLRELTRRDRSRFGYVDYLWSCGKLDALVVELTLETHRIEELRCASEDSVEFLKTNTATLDVSGAYLKGKSDKKVNGIDFLIARCVEMANQILNQLR